MDAQQILSVSPERGQVLNFIRVSEVARILTCSTQTVRNYTSQKRLRCFYSRDGERLYLPADVSSFKVRRDAERAALEHVRQQFRQDFPEAAIAV
jgi:DNA-binding transcriptional MerR regulator